MGGGYPGGLYVGQYSQGGSAPAEVQAPAAFFVVPAVDRWFVVSAVDRWFVVPADEEGAS